MNKPCQTPHCGYHWDGSNQRFFEGWYYRVTLPEWGQTFGFMYSIDDPVGGKSHSGGAAQILGANDQYLCRTFPDVKTFWASYHQLGLGHWGKTKLSLKPQLLDPVIFEQKIEEGYQANAILNQGYICDRATKNYCRWCYEIEPIDGWGNRNFSQKPTAGWLSFLPIFDPGWQVLMAHGYANGWIDWNGKIYDFTRAPAYSEKNWGRSFPIKWFWINCNSFLEESELTLTAVGGIREVFGWTESVGLIGLHYQGKFYQFKRENSQLSWQIKPWGRWEMEGKNADFTIKIVGTTDQAGNYVRVPTAEGLQFNCRDTMQGNLSLELRQTQGQLILKAVSHLGGLEVGGISWDNPWLYKTSDV
ncbi:tocopherol cyclase family protein [Crocosphaera sp. XPORK-15E]|uniref:tocopherol cyclase family protein n=1 Tax=Crocosphaera sp. XPORK-15E TaxID=3110247 RepID=UPI002B1FA940|nr:tocopherol cyclase family protein [Crocosphaera sp. XPORK-15E]MEA5535984.1 tocopherol cyclase family protein [Crocosphaera sp. XPORK-15E]